MRLLISVRNTEEALVAAAEGADFIDLKEPLGGALGGLPIAEIRTIVAAVREEFPLISISATVGDLAPQACAEILARVDAVAQCEVDLVKVGMPGRGGHSADALLQLLTANGHSIVPVLIADEGIDPAFFSKVCGLPFAGVMVDTQSKQGGSLVQLLPPTTLMSLVGCARRAGRMFGLAGALRVCDIPALRRLGPDFAGFRSAVCAGPRTASLSLERLRLLRAEFRCHESEQTV